MKSSKAVLTTALALVLATATVATKAATNPAPTNSLPALPVAGLPVSQPRETQYDFTSRITGRNYRIMVSTPFQADPHRTYPVVYLIDGNWYFRATADSVTESSGAARILPAIVVGVGYPTDNNSEVGSRRMLELSLPGGPEGKDADQSKFGGGDDFLRVLQEEVKPFIQSHYAVDETHQTLYGKSLGGLMVLRMLFQHPEAFQTYVAASPSIWWNHEAVLADEDAFSRLVRTGKLRLKIMVTSAGEERNSDASGLAARLAALNPTKVVVARAIFAGEDHVSVSLASIGRALTFALPR
jgi:predicted alpha/beta superfamily hydrolase